MSKYNVFLILAISYLACFFTLFSSTAFSNENLQLAFDGEIKTLCQLNMKNPSSRLDLNEKSSPIMPIELYCNQLMTLEITSENGGMKRNRHDIVIPYILSVDIPKAGIDRQIESQKLLSTVSLHSNDIPYSAIGTLRILLKEKPSLSGRYHDKITVNILPRLIISP